MWEPSINSKNSTGKDSLCACGKQCNYIDGCAERVCVETVLFLRGIFFSFQGSCRRSQKARNGDDLRSKVARLTITFQAFMT